MTRLPTLFLPLLAAGCATSTPTSSKPAELDRAQRLVRAGSYLEALEVTDAVLARQPGLAAAHVIAADANLGLYRGGQGNPQAFLLDAIRNLEAATAADATDGATWLKLAEAHRQSQDFNAGRDAALAAAAALRDKRAGAEAIAEAILAAADNEMQIFVAERRPESEAGEPPGEVTMAAAQAVLSRLRFAQTALPGKAASRAARVYQWLGQPDSALAEMERGILADPTEPEIHLAYQGYMIAAERRKECVAAYERMLRDAGEAPALVFYLGRARLAVADGLRGRSQWQEAEQAYAEARRSFARYLELQPQHQTTAKHMLAVCDLSVARIALDSGDLERAKDLYAKAYATDPRVLEHDANGAVLIADSFGGTYAGGLFQIGKTMVERSDPDSLRRGLAYFEAIIAKHPDRIGQFYNNAGLAARDLGAALARAGDEAAAAELWERSYRHYAKAVELVPDDPRIVNDCGLMLVYHLHRDYDRAKAMFDRAIELGESQLAALPADAPESERDFLEEAVGDAYQNIAVMWREQGKPFTEYRGMLEQAVQFYPYQRRTAALLLRSGGRGGDQGPAAASTRPAADPRDATFAPVAARAAELAAADDLDGALLALDAVATDLDGYGPFHATMGDYCLRYARAARANGGSAAQVGGLFADATRHLERARELDPESTPTRLLLATTLFDTGDFEAAATEAASLLSHVRARGDAGGIDLTAVQRLRAESSSRCYVAAKQAGDDDADALRAAREGFRTLEAEDAITADDLRTWVTLEQWAGAEGQALEVQLRALQRSPDDATLLDSSLTLAAQLGANAKMVEALDERGDALGRWYSGRALFNLAQEQWGGGDVAAAVDSLDRSHRRFTEAQAQNPAYADSCEQWQALALASKGIVLLGNGDLAGAEAALLASLRTRPDVAGNDLGGGNSAKRGILVLGSKYADDLPKLEALTRAASAALPDDADLANNHGLAARDLGNQLERDGEAAAANELYAASYESYRRAVAADPTNVRLRNDCALLDLYHVHRDLQESLAMLEAARDDGVRQLAEDPPADRQALRDLQEAVGDCFENIGYYWQHHGGDRDKAIAAYRRSLDYYPGERRVGVRRLQELGAARESGR